MAEAKVEIWRGERASKWGGWMWFMRRDDGKVVRIPLWRADKMLQYGDAVEIFPARKESK